VQWLWVISLNGRRFTVEVVTLPQRRAQKKTPNPKIKTHTKKNKEKKKNKGKLNGKSPGESPRKDISLWNQLEGGAGGCRKWGVNSGKVSSLKSWEGPAVLQTRGDSNGGLSTGESLLEAWSKGILQGIIGCCLGQMYYRGGGGAGLDLDRSRSGSYFLHEGEGPRIYWDFGSLSFSMRIMQWPGKGAVDDYYK